MYFSYGGKAVLELQKERPIVAHRSLIATGTIKMQLVSYI